MTTPTDSPDPTALRELFARVLGSLAPILPFERAEWALLGESGAVRAFIEPGGGQTRTDRRHYSVRHWPVVDAETRFVPDARAELDPTCEADRQLLESGARSLVVVPLRAGERSVGVLVLSSGREAAFDPAAATLLPSVRDLLAAAAERERFEASERVRQERRARLEALLPTIAESLDVRHVFPRLSQVIQGVVPHHVLAFAQLTPDRGGVKVQAATMRGVLDLPEYRFSSDEEALDSNWRHLLAHDLTAIDEGSVRARISLRDAAEVVEIVLRPGPAWMRFVTQAGIRSVLRVPIRARERPIGGVAFMSREADAYGEEDAALASRIADHVALALAHQELAEEERRIARAEERAEALEQRVEVLTRELEQSSAHRAIGQSAAWRKALADATQVAATDTTLLVTGESGTGKEVIARFVHRGSKRAKGPFVALNCAALPEPLLESELFGHERGAFTGAVEARAGKLEQAAGGVLFLDEVGEMTPSVQAKFLRVLQEREFQRVGGTKTIRVDVRIVAATNRDPRAAIATGTFREDLYYRLGVFEIHLPPLRERPEDILVLAESFLDEIGRTVGRPSAGLSEDAREQLIVHSWPGNVRELRNAIERAVILCQGGLVTREHLPVSLARPPAGRAPAAMPPPQPFPGEGVALGAVERDLLEQAMAKAGNNKSHAARLLGVSRGQLYSLLRRHGLTRARR